MASLIKYSGLVTYESEVVGGGSLDEADNVVLDEPFVIEKRRGMKEVGNSLATSSDRHKQLLVYKNRILRHYLDTLQFDQTGSFSFADFNGSYAETETGLRIKGKEVNGNLYFTAADGIKKISARNASELSTVANYITDAGGVKGLDLSGSVVFSAAGFLPPKSKVGYRLVWGIKDRNSNIILGTPSARLVITNSSEPTNVREVSTVTVSGALTASEYFLLSAKDIEYYVWFNVSGTDAKPQTAETIGKQEIEVSLVGISTNDARAAAIGNAVSEISDFEVSVNGSVVTITIADETAGDVADIVEMSGGATNLTTANLVQGSVTSGKNANTEIRSYIPQEILSSSDPTRYFYQLYRTAVSTATEELEITDVDPGDEHNLIFELAVTAADITAETITIQDITPESFRESGAFLYTNPITAQGILQANERPPIAKDIELFRNHTFYANTKTLHRLSLDLLSVSDFTSGTSEIIIGNSQDFRTYTFVGTPESFDVTCDSRTATTSGGYIVAYSANDNLKYAFWFDKTGSDSAPSVADAELVRVNISSAAGVADTNVGTATALLNVVNSLADFSASIATATVTIVCTNNGNATDAAIGSSLGGVWAIGGVVNGTGEDISIQQVLLSGLASSAQAIEETARSLVNVINADPDSIVNAYYVSSPEDLPGKISFESRELSDDAFVVFTSDSPVQSMFNPMLPLNETIADITFSSGSGSPAQITSVAHDLSTGDEVYLYNTATVPVLLGLYEVTVIDPDNFTVPVNITTEDTPSSAFFVFPSVQSDNAESGNRVYFSKVGQPEAVPLLNYLDIGAKDKVIKRILSLRDNLFVLKEDGVYIVTGTSSPFTSRLLDSSTSILAADSAVVLNNLIYALTVQGVVSISESGVSIISRPIENKILDVINLLPSYSTQSFGVGYETDRAYILWMPTNSIDTTATQAYRYNTINKNWTRWTIQATCGVVRTSDDLLYVGAGNRSYLTQERKNRNRTDYADREIDLTIANGAVDNLNLELSSVAEVAVGDVIYQEEYVSISLFNRLLLKLDLDSGIDNDYVSAIGEAQFGDSLSSKLDALNTKLLSDDLSGVITDHTPFSADFNTLRTQYNALITELNNSGSDTNLKNYKEATDLVSFEAIVESVDTISNTVTLNIALPWIVGAIKCYKAINVKFTFAYQAFGEPEMLKQIREATVLYDQNNFYDAYLSFKTDISQSFEQIRKFGQRIGTWGYPGFGNYVFGGDGTDEGIRVLVPQSKQRCRYITMRIEHKNAREKIRCLGISAQPRLVSSRGYRSRNR